MLYHFLVTTNSKTYKVLLPVCFMRNKYLKEETGMNYCINEDRRDSDDFSKGCILKKLITADMVQKYENNRPKNKITDMSIFVDVTDGCNYNCFRKEVAQYFLSEDIIEQNKEISNLEWWLGQKANKEISDLNLATAWSKSGLSKAYRADHDEIIANGQTINNHKLFERLVEEVHLEDQIEKLLG